jgi:hypothetical protein
MRYTKKEKAQALATFEQACRDMAPKVWQEVKRDANQLLLVANLLARHPSSRFNALTGGRLELGAGDNSISIAVRKIGSVCGYYGYSSKVYISATIGGLYFSDEVTKRALFGRVCEDGSINYRSACGGDADIGFIVHIASQYFLEQIDAAAVADCPEFSELKSAIEASNLPNWRFTRGEVYGQPKAIAEAMALKHSATLSASNSKPARGL